MIRHMKRPMALRTKLFMLPILIILVMSMLCGTILFLEYRAATELTGSLDMGRLYNQFDIAFSRFRTAFNLYANSFDRKYLKECYDQLDLMAKYSNEMVQDFPAQDSILENDRLVNEYATFTINLIDRGAGLSVTEFWNLVAEADSIAAQIGANAHQVQLLYLQNIAAKSDLSIELWQTQMQISLVFVVLILMFLLFSVNRVIQSIISPIMRLVYYAKRISVGDFNYHFEAPKDADLDEISLLTSTFVYMSETISQQMHELQDKITLTQRLHTLEMQNINIQLSLAEKEMALMQSMINPHFLFNCLGTVSSMAIIENAPRTQDIATKIARYLRGSVNLVGAYVPMHEELNLLNQYIYIQSLRFGERISIHIQCDPACENALVPALFLQPLVENSFVHGLQGVLHDGVVTVAIVQRPAGQLTITISDNGCGIAPDRLEDLRAGIRQSFENGQPYIGLHSVISQFDIMFKDQYRFDIESAPGAGTHITIQFPMRQKDEAADPMLLSHA